MFRQEMGFFGFYLRLILVLVFAATLLCQSQDHRKASQVTEIESCSHAASAWSKNDDFEQVVKDREHFLFNLLNCTKETHNLILETSETENCKTFDEMIPSVLVSEMNKKIAEVIDTPCFAAREQRLILFAVYLVHINHKIRYFSCLANSWTKDITLTPKHRKSFELELKQYILDDLDSTLMAHWESDNITILEKSTDTLRNMSINFSKILINLLDKIRSDIDKTYTWWSWLFSFISVRSERENITKLDELKKQTVTLRNKLVTLKTPGIDPGLWECFLNSIRQKIPILDNQFTVVAIVLVVGLLVTRSRG